MGKQIKRKLGYDDDGKPCMILRRNTPPRTTFQLEPEVPKSFCIRLIDAWKYSEEHNPQFERYMWNICYLLFEILDLGIPNSREMAVLATIIQEGLDDLIHMPPQRKTQKTIGHIKLIQNAINGEGSQVIVDKDLNVSVPV